MPVGFIGLGTMGQAMAANLLRAGHPLVVHDVQPGAADRLVAEGAVRASTPADVAARAEVILTSLPGPAEVATVALAHDGILAAAVRGTVHLDLSTNSPHTVRELADRYDAAGLHFLDAPVSGGPTGARSGELTVWVGGEQSAFDRARPVLEGLADRVTRVGDIGAGTVVKLVHNAAGNAINLVLAELFILADAAGVDPLTVWRSIREGAVGRRRTFDGLAAHFLLQRYDPASLTLELARKDTRLLTKVADAVQLPTPWIRGTLARMEEAVERGWGARDSRVTMLLEQERAGHLLSPVSAEAIAEVLDASRSVDAPEEGPTP